MSKASLEDVKNILNHYNQGSIVVDGVNYYYNINPLDAACLNERYRELTGHNHPVFVKEQGKVLDEIIKSEVGIRVNGNPTIYEQLKNNTMEIGSHNHILTKTNKIFMNLQETSLEDISALLNYYNGKPVLIDGIIHHPFNDPISASKLNARYRELTGHNHPVFIEQVPKVIEDLLKDKDMLVQVGAHDMSYFEKLEKMKQETRQDIEKNSDERKRIFIEERERQRKLDASVRVQQINSMKEINEGNSIGGMNR